MREGHVVAIFIAKSQIAEMLAVPSVRATPHIGLEGDNSAGGIEKNRGVRICSQDALRKFYTDQSLSVWAEYTRQNITVSDIELVELVGRYFKIGDVLMYGRELFTIDLQPYCSLISAPVRVNGLTTVSLAASVVSFGMIQVNDQITVAFL